MVWGLQCLELDFLKELSIILITIVIFGFFLLFLALIPIGHGHTGGHVPHHGVWAYGKKVHASHTHLAYVIVHSPYVVYDCAFILAILPTPQAVAVATSQM